MPLQGAVLAGDLDDLRLDQDLDALGDLDGLHLSQGLHRSSGGECDNTRQSGLRACGNARAKWLRRISAKVLQGGKPPMP
jgi:hypothetical protein